MVEKTYYRCKKLNSDAWAKAFEVGQEYELVDIMIDNEVGLVLANGNTDYLVPPDCFDLVDKNTTPPTEELAPIDPLETQIGGEHYKSKGVQPIEYILSNNLTYVEGNVIKYITRWKDKNGVEDLKKAKHYIEILIAENE